MKRLCLDDETIMDYVEDRLAQRIRGQVEEHLCRCAECRDLLMVAAELYHDTERYHPDPVPSAVTQRAIEAVETISKGQSNWSRCFLDGSRRLFSWGRVLLENVTTIAAPQPVLRSGPKTVEDDLIRDHIIVSDFEAVIELEKTTATHFTVQIERISNKPSDIPIRVSLFAKTHEVASSTLLHEAVQFEDIPNGKYVLTFSQANRQLDEYAFEVPD